jgi:hypothetical protein
MSDKNPSFGVGYKYRVRYQLPQQRIMREAVMKFLGSEEYHLIFDLRPLAGTQRVPRSCIKSAVQVPNSTDVYFDRKVQ